MAKPSFESTHHVDYYTRKAYNLLVDAEETREMLKEDKSMHPDMVDYIIRTDLMPTIQLAQLYATMALVTKR